MIPLDFHTHTVASGHGACNTIADLAKAAHQKGMTALGISDHGPATPGSCKESYFRSLKMAPGSRSGISLYYGAEANILDVSGRLDLCSEVLGGLDFVIASLHGPTYHISQGSGHTNAESNTLAYINAMKNPYVRLLGHTDDTNFPVDSRRLVKAAAANRVILEVNEASLALGGYRGNTRANMRSLLSHCITYHHPVLLSSDSHSAAGVGETPCALELLRELDFPRELILNYQKPEAFLRFR